MRRALAGLVLALTLLGAGPARAYDDGGDYGNGNDQRRCHHAEGDCRGSFSPGPFDRSPVDIHDNQVCISPDCSGRDKDRQPRQPQRATGVACLVPAPWHCDQPHGFVPPNPAKIPQQISDFVKVVGDFVVAVVRFAV